MGKKSKESNEEVLESDAVKSLFSDSNPFRRKPDSDTPPPQPPVLRKRAVNPNPNSPPSPEPSSKKRKKAENNHNNNEVEAEALKSRKRKRKNNDDIEMQYEKRVYGEIAEKEEEKVVNVKNVKAGEKRKVKEDEIAVLNNQDEEDEEFDDESKLLRTIFVGNLEVKIKKKVLVKEFQEFGDIKSVRIRSVPLVNNKAPRKGAIIGGKINEDVGRVNAYIVFGNEQAAQAALSKNMSMIGENHIRVDMACPPRKKFKGDTELYERKKTVFVGNVPFDVKDEELYKLFCGPDQSESTVEAIRVIRDPITSAGKGIAYVLFKSREAANAVVRKGGLKIRDRELRLCHAARSDAMPIKKKEVESKKEARKKKFAEITKSRENQKTKPSAASLSYQGVRSSKSGVVKKSGVSSQQSSVYDNTRGTKRTGGEIDSKGKKTKRPAVAARKAKQLMKKRKQENGSLDNSRLSKKAKLR